MVRAKFTVQEIGEYSHSPGQKRIVMVPVYSTDPHHENKAFWDATPNGRLEMYIQNPEAARHFTLGAEYYVDFTKA